LLLGLVSSNEPCFEADNVVRRVP
jgi:hypothetical protein